MRKYHRRKIIGEAFRAMHSLKGQAFAAIMAIVAVMLISGALIMVELNVIHIAKQLGMPIHMTIYAVIDADEAVVKQETQTLSAMDGVLDAKFVSRDEALTNMQSDMLDDDNLLEGYTIEDNPLPMSIELQIDDRDVASALYDQYNSTAWVDSTLYEKEIIEKLEAIGKNFGIITLVMGSILLFIGLMVVWNVVNMAVQAQKNEQMLLRQLGASNWAIVMPYCTMGGIIGSIGAMIASGLLSIGYVLLLRGLSGIEIPVTFLSLNYMTIALVCCLVLLGFTFGSVAGALAVRRGVAGSRTMRIHSTQIKEVNL